MFTPKDGEHSTAYFSTDEKTLGETHVHGAMEMPPVQEKAFDLAIAGELNLDLILYGLPLVMETERELLASSFVSTLGSSSAIVAHNAAALGLRVRFATVIGEDDFGKVALDRLKQAGVDTTDTVVDPAISTGVTMLLPHGAVRHCLSYLGATTALTVERFDWARLAEARHFHLSSLYLQTGLHAGIVDLLRYLKNAGLTISLDTNDDPSNGWEYPLADVLPFVDVFLPSESEICRMAGGVEIDLAIQKVSNKVPMIVVKRGRHGCRVSHQGEVIDYPGIAVTPVDTIGAGDSFNAGFLYAYLKGMSIPTCAHAGNVAGALSTLSPGGTEAYRDRALQQAFLREHRFAALGEEN